MLILLVQELDFENPKSISKLLDLLSHTLNHLRNLKNESVLSLSPEQLNQNLYGGVQI